jgi:RNA methyltransferase, TrmH family
MELISSRDNPRLKHWRRLSQQTTAYRKAGQIWLEGDHLCRAAHEKGQLPLEVVWSQSGLARYGAQFAAFTGRSFCLPDPLFAAISGLESATGMAFVLDVSQEAPKLQSLPTVVLDRLQDPGNVGSILRSAAAFGFTQVLALQGTAALYGPKVLRAAMGAHFSLFLHEELSLETLGELPKLGVPLVVTSSHQGQLLHRCSQGPWPCAWVLGHEGQGVSTPLMTLADHVIRIGQPAGEESLNVASAAAICMHASVHQWAER